jgi:hypothetical protein
MRAVQNWPASLQTSSGCWNITLATAFPNDSSTCDATQPQYARQARVGGLAEVRGPGCASRTKGGKT